MVRLAVRGGVVNPYGKPDPKISVFLHLLFPSCVYYIPPGPSIKTDATLRQKQNELRPRTGNFWLKTKR